jgi:hypothetical protein
MACVWDLNPKINSMTTTTIAKNADLKCTRIFSSMSVIFAYPSFLIIVRRKETDQAGSSLIYNLPSQPHYRSIPSIAFTLAILSIKTTIQTQKYNE